MPLVELGTPNPLGRHDDPVAEARLPKRPVITYMNIPDILTFKRDVDVEHWRGHLTNSIMRNNGITNYSEFGGGDEMLCQLTHPGNSYFQGAQGDPDTAWSDDPDCQRILSEYFQCPAGRPTDVDETHWRRVGRRILAPGVPVNVVDMDMLLVNSGCTAVAQNVGGGAVTPVTGTGTAATATTLTTALTTSSTTQYTGARVYCMAASTGPLVYGNILSCTNGASAVLTVDQWYNPSSPGGSAGSTPASGYYFVIADGGDVSNWFMAITTTNISPAPPTPPSRVDGRPPTA